MEGMAGQKSTLTWVVNLAALLLVVMWTIPTAGLFVSSFRDRLAGAGISAVQPDPERDAPPPSITVIDISGSYPRFDGCDAPTIFVRGLTDDQGDLFQTWLQRRRATMSAADAEIEVPKDDPGAGQATTG